MKRSFYTVDGAIARSNRAFSRKRTASGLVRGRSQLHLEGARGKVLPEGAAARRIRRLPCPLGEPQHCRSAPWR
jgi:hypothetical protein